MFVCCVCCVCCVCDVCVMCVVCVVYVVCVCVCVYVHKLEAAGKPTDEFQLEGAGWGPRELLQLQKPGGHTMTLPEGRQAREVRPPGEVGLPVLSWPSMDGTRPPSLGRPPAHSPTRSNADSSGDTLNRKCLTACLGTVGWSSWHLRLTTTSAY